MSERFVSMRAYLKALYKYNLLLICCALLSFPFTAVDSYNHQCVDVVVVYVTVLASKCVRRMYLTNHLLTYLLSY